VNSRRPTLTRDDIVTCAMAIVESEGIDGLTMRALADKLGVAVTSIYWHMGSKLELELAMVGRIGPEIFLVRGRGSTPEAQIVSIARSLFAAFSSHTQLAGLAHRLGRLEELLSPARRVLAEAFAAAGLRGVSIADATNAIIQFVGDRATFQNSSARWPQQRFDGSPLWHGKPPVGAAAAKRLAARPDSERIFNLSLRALVRGLLSE
jgi:TetR/AcrR family tetracycline transcriptional repressor